MSVSVLNTVGSPTLRPTGPMPPTDRPTGNDAGPRGVSPLTTGPDEVEFSAAGRMLSESNTGDLRAERLASIKAAIDDGSYETAEKLDIALSRMIGAVWNEDD